MTKLMIKSVIDKILSKPSSKQSLIKCTAYLEFCLMFLLWFKAKQDTIKQAA